METLIIIAGGLIGGGSSFSRNFLSVWLWYVNTIFALVPALGLAPRVAAMLELPFLPLHLRATAAFFCLFIIGLVILFKISEQILPNPEEVERYPVLPGKIIGALCGFLMGCCYASILVYLAGSVPMLSGTIPTAAFKAAGAKTLYNISYTAAFQSLPDEKTCLGSLNALPASPAKEKSKAEEQKNKTSEVKEEKPKRRKTQKELDQEMLRKIDQAQKEYGYDTGETQRRSFATKKKRKKRRKRAFTASTAGNIRMKEMATRMTTDGAVRSDESGFSAVPVPDQQDVKNAARQARRSSDFSTVNP